MMRTLDHDPVTFGWTHAIVSHRLTEAMRVLHRLPEGRNFQKLRGTWPSDTFAKDPVSIARDEFVAARYRLELPKSDQEEMMRDRVRQWAKTPPSPGQIANMEQALLWPGRYLKDADRQFINFWSYYIGVESKAIFVQMRFGISRQQVWRRSTRICTTIATALNADMVPVL